jgi:hypothetical protein
VQPDGTVLEGYFQDNIYKGPTPPEELMNDPIVEEIDGENI